VFIVILSALAVKIVRIPQENFWLFFAHGRDEGIDEQGVVEGV